MRIPRAKKKGKQLQFETACIQTDSRSTGSTTRSAGLQACLNVIVEVTGEVRKDKAAKVTTAQTLWVPAVNNHR